MATENFHSVADDSKFVPLEVPEEPVKLKVEKVSTVEDDWIKLRTQN